MNRFLAALAFSLLVAGLAAAGCRDVPVDTPTAGDTPADTAIEVTHSYDTLFQHDQMIVTDTTFRAIRVRDQLVRIDTLVRRETQIRPVPQSFAIPFLTNHRGENDSVVIDIRYATRPEFEMESRLVPRSVRFDLALPLSRYISPERFRFVGLKLVHLNVPRLTLRPGDTLPLLVDPGAGAGAAISVDRKRLATGDSVLGRMSSGWVTVRAINPERRFVRLRMHGDFLRWPEKAVAFDMALELGY